MTTEEIIDALKHNKSKAESTSGLSPSILKDIKGIEVSLQIIFNACLSNGDFLEDKWLESAMFLSTKRKIDLTLTTTDLSIFKPR